MQTIVISRRRAVAASLALALISVVAACGGGTAAGVDPTGSIVIDVRSPEEFAAGHLEGAVNLNVEDGTLLGALPSFDPSVPYIVYCRSGRRSAIAVDQMRGAGFTDILDLGSVEDAASVTGLQIVR
jgi:rhodanese-related sulfurtransferase